MKIKVAVIVCFCLMALGCYYSNNLLPNRQKKTYATLVKLDVFEPRGGSYDVFEFAVNDKKYSFTKLRTIGYVLGDKFEIAYDSMYPEKAFSLLTYNPVFLQNEKTENSVGVVVRLPKHEDWLSFDYWVNGVKHHRIQDLKYNTRTYKSLSLGGVYLIKYWCDNPQRSLLYYSRLIESSQDAVAEIAELKNTGPEPKCYSLYHFQYNNDTLKGRGICLAGMTKGDKFKMTVYTSKGVSLIKDVRYHEPLFTEDEKTDTSGATVSMKSGYRHNITFTYKLKGIQYVKEQIIVGSKHQLKQIKRFKVFRIRYLISNPQRAIIYLDQPLD